MNLLLVLLGLLVHPHPVHPATPPRPLEAMQPVSYRQVQIQDPFWSPRLDSLWTATSRVLVWHIEHSPGRLDNFERVDHLKAGGHVGWFFNDSDVYKTLEALSYLLQAHPEDTFLLHHVQRWIALIQEAQLPDGYVDTYFQLRGLQGRWTDMGKHEMYCMGHLIEAGLAYQQATGDSSLLKVGIRAARHIMARFGPGRRTWVPGHEEIELALCKLFEASGDSAYLREARWFLQERGHGYGVGDIWDPGNRSWAGPAYCQDQVPVTDIRRISGHAVRSMYLYSGMADVARLMEDSSYWRALLRVWPDVVDRNMYVTGGIGSSGTNEGFTRDYDLPNSSAYEETCASVGMVFWNARMNRISGDARYADQLERTLYNAALAGISLSGRRFFYDNPMESSGSQIRQQWFSCACCPPNIARLMGSLGGYIYGTARNRLYVNLYIGNTAHLKLDGAPLAVQLHTTYPVQGTITLKLMPRGPQHFCLLLRKPGFADSARVSVNSHLLRSWRVNQGYIELDRTWRPGDVVRLELPMQVRKLSADPRVLADRGRRVFMRGPLVYCMEQPGDSSTLTQFRLSPHAQVQPVFQAHLLGGLETLELRQHGRTYELIPYEAWANRGPSSMEVWLPLGS